MNRRHLLLTAAAISALPLLPAHAAIAGAQDYTPKVLKAELAAGKTVFLDFKASWCTTCKAQERVINALVSENPAYGAISFVSVDWDQWGDGDLVAQLGVPRRSTLVVLKGDKELGRIVAGTSREDIQALMDVALAAATA
jgi:thioredoxin 1